MILRTALLSLWLSLLLAGCSAATSSAQSDVAAVQLPPSAPTNVGTDSIRIWHGGSSTFDRLLSLINGARRSVEVEMYEFGRVDLRDALIAARQRGTAVSVIVDPSVDVSAITASQLRAAGVTVIDYPVRKLMIDHVKLLITDSTVAMVGGINWGAQSYANHDFDAEVRGPVVSNLSRVFLRDLVTCGQLESVPPYAPDPAIVVASTLPAAEIRPLAVRLIDGASRRIDLELFVLTDTAIVHALQRAVRRGVPVNLLLDPSQRPSDAPAALLASSGVDVRLYRSHGELLHAKALVTDNTSVLFGSANWSSGGFDRNHEVDLEMENQPAIAAAFTQQMTADWIASG